MEQSPRLHLVADDPEAEVARMLGLGASLIARRPGEVELADPDGNEFTLAPYI